MTERLELRRDLAGRLGPLTFVLVAVMSVSAPLAYVLMGTASANARASTVAAHAAETVRVQVQERPRLWRYDTAKIVEQLRTYESYATVDRVEVVDEGGRRVDLGAMASSGDDELVWAYQSVEFDGEERTGVWVGVSTAQVRANGRLMLLSFAVLGLLLGGSIHVLSMRAVGRSESRIRVLVSEVDARRAELRGLADSLEAQVKERSARLSDALAEVEDKERNLRELSARAQAADEAQRRAISRELHDSAGQALTAIRINLQLLRDKSGDSKQADLAARTLAMADTTVDEIRRVVDRLAPAVLDDLGLAAALRRHTEDFADRRDVDLNLDIEGLAEGERFDEGVETACYRIVQEALTNVARHARAREVSIVLRRDAQTLVLQLSDDGVGMDVEQASRKGRRGLAGMRERVELLGGELSFASQPGEGTRIEVVIPLERGGNHAAARETAGADPT